MPLSNKERGDEPEDKNDGEEDVRDTSLGKRSEMAEKDGSIDHSQREKETEKLRLHPDEKENRCRMQAYHIIIHAHAATVEMDVDKEIDTSHESHRQRNPERPTEFGRHDAETA